MKKTVLLSVFILLPLLSSLTYAEMITLRPNATITAPTTLRGCTSAWDCLDEVDHDSTATAAAITSTTLLAMLDFNDTKSYISGGLPSGARINWVLATGVIRDAVGSAGANNAFLRLNVSSGSARSIYNTSDLNPGAAWAEKNHTNYTTNPKSGNDWTLADVDGLMLGFDGNGDATPPPNATQLSIKVGYTPVITANASFASGSTASIDLGQSVVFNGTCNANGGTATTVALYIQDNSTGSWANMSGDTAANIYTNRTVYNISSLSGTSDNMFFSVTAQTSAALYSLRVQCNAVNAVPAEANSTESNLTVNGAADTCTPTDGQDWLLNCADNCQLHNKHYSVRKINITGTGVTLFSASSINYTYFSLPRTCRLAFNGTFAFRRRP